MRARAIAAIVGTTLAWAGIYIVADLIVDSIDPISMSLLRWAPAAVLLLVLAQLIERPDWRAVLRQWPKLLLLGCLGLAGFSTLLLEGLRHTTAVSGSIIGAAGPVLIAVSAALILRQRIGWRVIVGLALSVVGVLLVVTQGSLSTLLEIGVNIGDLWVILATLCWTAYVLLGRLQAGIPVITSTAVQAALASIVLGVIVAFTGLQFPKDALSWTGIAYISLIGSALALYLWTYGMRTLAPATAGILLNLSPLFTVALALLFGDAVGPWEAIGGAVILGGVVLGTLPARRRAAVPSSEKASPEPAGPDCPRPRSIAARAVASRVEPVADAAASSRATSSAGA